MAPNAETIERVAPYVGSMVFATVLAVTFWTTAMRSFGPADGMHPLSFFFSLNALLFAMAIPFAVPAFFRSRAKTRKGRQLWTLAGFVFAFGFFLGVGFLGVHVLVDFGIDTTYESIAFFDAMTGVVYGAMFGYDATSSAVDWHRRTRTPDATF